MFWHFNVRPTPLENENYLPQTGPEEKKDINYRIMDQILRFGNEKAGDKSVSDLLEYQKMDLWFYQRLTVYMAARNIEYLLEEIRLASKKYSVILYTDIHPDILAKHLPENIEYKYHKNQAVSLVKMLSIGFSMIYAVARVCFRSTSKIRGKHLILDNAKPLKISQGPGTDPYKGNFVFNNLFKILDKRFCLITEAGMPGKRTAKISDYRNSYQYRILKLSNISSDQILARAMLNRTARKEIMETRRELGLKLDSLALKFRDTEYSIITYLLTGLKSSFRIYISRYIGFREICLENKPLSLTASDENSPFNKSLIDACRYLDIKTFGIQHGAIHDLHPAYRLTPEEAGKNITADLSLVWGDYWKDHLIRTGNYLPSALKVSGQIRTDTIPLLQNSGQAQGEKRIILFASQPQRDPSLREKAAADLFKAASKVENIIICLKPHPLEKDYYKYYSDIAKKYGTVNIRFRPDDDLYELINSADAVYTCFSTVGTEAVYFYKPLIIHDPLEQDIQSYISSGVGHRVRNEDECESALRQLTSDLLTQDKKAASKFITDYAFLIDGKVSKRVLSEITGDS